MKNITATFIAECMKLRRSKIFWITIVFFIFIPIMMGLLMFVAQNPEISAKLGLVGTKAKLFGTNNWEGFFGILNQMMAIVGLIGFGFVTSWVFGREYMEHTLIDILGLPVPRSSIVIAKLIVILLWCFLLSLVLFSTGLIIGQLMYIPEWSVEVFIQFINTYIKVSLLTILLSTPVAFIASYGRGIIAPLGFVIFMLIMAQFVAIVGLGPYFPWAIPGMLSVPAGTEGMELFFGSYVIVFLTSLIGFSGTIMWWRMADQH